MWYVVCTADNQVLYVAAHNAKEGAGLGDEVRSRLAVRVPCPR